MSAKSLTVLVLGVVIAATAVVVRGTHGQPAAATPASSRDRVYTADQVSNTVSVVDPVAGKLLGVIRLGDPVTGAMSPLYKRALLVHGLGYSPDHRTLAVISVGSNSVTLIDTATNAIKGVVYIGRAPHEGFFTPDGRELWVVVRGENYISVIDPTRLREVRRIETANGPGMVLFSPDGRYAYVPSSFTPEFDVIDTQRSAVVARVPQVSAFSPNLAVSRDGSEVWITLKDVGKAQVFNGRPPFSTVAVLETGPITNHVALIDNQHGRFAYVTVGGLNQVKVYRRERQPVLVTTIPTTGDLPHGIWPSADGSRVYVGLENGGAVQVIDTLTNQSVATIPVGQLPQALVYVPDAVPTGPGTANLEPLGVSAEAVHIEMGPPAAGGSARASVVANALGPVDAVQIAATGLEPGQQYQLALVGSPAPPFTQRKTLAAFKASPQGTAIAQTVGPVRGALSAVARNERRYLAVTTSTGVPALVQTKITGTNETSASPR